MTHSVPRATGRHQTIIRNVDECIGRFWDRRLNNPLFVQSLVAETFPILESYILPISDPRASRCLKYLAARMRRENPEASHHVYALCFQTPEPEEETSEQEEQTNEQPEGDDWHMLDKVGVSVHYRTRRGSLPGAAPVKGLVFAGVVALFPVQGEGAALHLEHAIHDSLPREDWLSGEWYASTFGIWKTLLRWHLACFGSWRTARRANKRRNITAYKQPTMF
jgi:hypothetical protein